MTYRKYMGILAGTLLGMALLVTSAVSETLKTSKGYSVEDFTLKTAEDLLDICTIETSHADYAIATAFCLGFFEGASHYDDAISVLETHVDIVCSPDGTTRSEAVTVFLEHQQANPQYGAEAPIDAVFRALVVEWPCP
jgi:hypothetical protein